MRKFLLCLSVAVLLTGCGARQSNTSGRTAAEDPLPAIGFRYYNYSKESTELRKGEVFSSLFQRAGLSARESYALAQICDTTFNVRRMRPGDKVDFYYAETDSTRQLCYAVYNHDRVHQTVFRLQDSLAIWNYTKPVQRQERIADVTISRSLWQDMVDGGAPASMISELSDIFAWTVDFFGLQEGDRFQVVYDVLICEDELIGSSDVKFARFTSGSHTVNAIRYVIQGSSDKYFNEKGENLRKAFLKAPLKFNRVSSKFSYNRKHPVTGKVRPHTGVDYAAPSGTPVHALGDGVVQSAGWTNTGGGNTIKIKHNSVYTTGYLHLKGFAKGIKAGVRVSQGQLIGYVGSTGTSTGPHLDFRVWKNGTPIDPLRMESPSAEPIPSDKLPELQELYNRYSKQIEQ